MEGEADEQRMVLHVQTVGVFKTERRTPTPPALNLTSAAATSSVATWCAHQTSPWTTVTNPATQTGAKIFYAPAAPKQDHPYARHETGWPAVTSMPDLSLRPTLRTTAPSAGNSSARVLPLKLITSAPVPRPRGQAMIFTPASRPRAEPMMLAPAAGPRRAPCTSIPPAPVPEPEREHVRPVLLPLAQVPRREPPQPLIAPRGLPPHLRPEQGVVPTNTPKPARMPWQAESLWRLHYKRAVVRGDFMKNTRHLKGTYVTDPLSGRWRCLRCFTDTTEDWEIKTVHCAASKTT